VGKADIDPMAPNVRFGFKPDIALASSSLRPVLAQSRHRLETDKFMLLGLGVSQQVANAKLLAKKRSASDGRGTAGDPDRVNEALDVSLSTLSRLRGNIPGDRKCTQS